MPPTLAVSEIFGPTIQGEGLNAGQPCAFLRLAACNLACSWCDTPYTWDWTRFHRKDEIQRMPLEAVLPAIDRLGQHHLVITGGEPMLQQKALKPLARLLHDKGYYLEMETAGTIAPESTELVDLFTVSPKLANSGNSLKARLVPDVLQVFATSHRAVFKFVVCRESDFDEIDELVARFHLDPVFVMPEGQDSAKLRRGARWLVGPAMTRGYRLSPRLHVDLWGRQRGV